MITNAKIAQVLYEADIALGNAGQPSWWELGELDRARYIAAVPKLLEELTPPVTSEMTEAERLPILVRTSIVNALRHGLPGPLGRCNKQGRYNALVIFTCGLRGQHRGPCLPTGCKPLPESAKLPVEKSRG